MSGTDDQRKDRTLQARIPEHLDRELRRRAGRLGLSVSTVVRNVLMHTFDLVDDIVTDSAALVRDLHAVDRPGRGPHASRRAPGEDRPPPQEPPAAPERREDDDAVLGWQELVLNRNAVCEHCNAILPRGTKAAIGVPIASRPVFVCRACLAAVAAESRGTVTADGAED